jgi:hypothetical protein
MYATLGIILLLCALVLCILVFFEDCANHDRESH